ncbi:Domain of unknown function DUF551 [uncultured Caudovirales phage]|uniref:DUF551 domain-containing protein n=1 Tax=uncultured Caudovirales phage TaxID=2100421 RepID=A0A6J5KNK1_9CAUD|nr:Domain of unknown function DUF551 [uncultured Caudovirales phage]
MTMTNAEAVEYLKEHQGWYREGVWCREVDEALTLAITALEATGEPVAWRARDEDDRQWVHVGHNPRTPFKICEPLYLHPAPSVPAWQPIETAPDGMVIDVWYAPVKTIPCRVPNAHRDGDRWYDGTGNRMWHTPTHWMPLPPAPEVKP